MPATSVLDEYYRSSYRQGGFNAAVALDRFPHDQLWYLSRGRALSRLLDDWARQTGKLVSRVLDVGAGFGHVLWCLREANPNLELFACEPDPVCAPFLERCRAKVLPIALSSAEAVSVPMRHGPFDAIVLSHVLEHVCEPVDWLGMLSTLLADEGLLLIEVPHDPAREIHWTGNHAPHISFFEPPSLGHCIQRSGGTAIFVDTCGPLHPSSQPLWRRASLGVLRRIVPASIRAALGRRVDNRAIAAGYQPIADTRTIPLASFGEYGGADRVFLRAVARYSRNGLESA